MYVCIPATADTVFVHGLHDSRNYSDLLVTWASVPASQGPIMPDGQPMHAVIVTRTASLCREQWACLLLPDEDLAPLQVLIAATVLHLKPGRQNEARNDLPHIQEQRPTPEEHHHREPVVEGRAEQGHIIQCSSHLLAEHHCLHNHTVSSLALAYSCCGISQHTLWHSRTTSCRLQTSSCKTCIHQRQLLLSLQPAELNTMQWHTCRQRHTCWFINR